MSLAYTESAPVRDTRDTQESPGGRTLDSGDQSNADTHEGCVAAADPPPEPVAVASPIQRAARADALLLIYADLLDDLERVRLDTENRVRSLGDYGLANARLIDMTARLKAEEHGAELELKRALRTHPLGPWVKRTVGIGEKQGARLLAAIGDPYWNTLHDRPRTVSELWAYCGYHVLNPGRQSADTQRSSAGVDPLAPSRSNSEARREIAGGDPSSDTAHGVPDTQPQTGGVAPKRRKGQKANWNATAKMRAYLCAESCIKQRHSPYRAVYDARRAHTADTHPEWTDGHSHNDALRVVAKEILKDLWREAKAIHEDAA